jgi:RNA polymerase sigma-70 factor (ECF subfamily)
VEARHNLKNLRSSGVFHQPANVQTGDMNAVSVALAGAQQQRENLRIAHGLKHGDSRLLDQLIVEYQHRLLRYLLYLTSNRELAEDLFQETWMRVLQRGGQYNGAARFETWLFTIARNLVIDTRRKRTMASLDEMCDTGDDERPFEVASGDPTPLEECLRGEDSERVAEALLCMEPLNREVLVLRFHEDLSLAEIATVTRAPLSTVKSRLYRGLSSLKTKIAPGADGHIPRAQTAFRQISGETIA